MTLLLNGLEHDSGFPTLRLRRTLRHKTNHLPNRENEKSTIKLRARVDTMQRRNRKFEFKFCAHLGYPGEGPGEEDQGRVCTTLASWNINKGFAAKIEYILWMCVEHDIDMIALSETRQGARVQATCKRWGYYCIQSEKTKGGVAILMKIKLAKKIKRTTVKERGTLLEVQTEKEGLKIIFSSIYNESGLDKAKEDEEKTVNALQRTRASTRGEGSWDLRVVAGDWNETEIPGDRWRGKAIKTRTVGVGRTMAVMKAEGFKETHQNNKIWTHVQGEGDRETRSRIDRIYFKSTQPSTVLSAKVIVPMEATSDHHLVLTKLSTQAQGTSKTTPKKAKRATENNYPRVAGQPTPVLEKFAKHVAKILNDNNRKWGSKLVNYDSIEELDDLIANIIERIKEVGMKFL